MAQVGREWTTMAALAAWLVTTVTPTAERSGSSTSVYFGSLGAYHAVELASFREDFERAHREGLDFLAITTRTRAASLSTIAASANAAFAGRFVAMSGWQYGAMSPGNPVNVLELSDLVDENAVPHGRYDLFYRSWLPRHEDTTASAPILQFPEPRDPAIDYGRLDMESLEALREAAAPYVRTIQVASRTQEAARQTFGTIGWRPYLHYLNAGFRLAPTADWESAPGQGPKTDQRTAVLARELSKVEILEGIRQRRVYASDDRNLRVSFSINGQPMGSVVPLPVGTSLRIELTLSDPDEPEAYYWLSLRRDTPGGELDAAQELSGTDHRGDGRIVFTQFRRRSGIEYFLASIVQASAQGTDRIWTAPIWLVSTE